MDCLCIIIIIVILIIGVCICLAINININNTKSNKDKFSGPCNNNVNCPCGGGFGCLPNDDKKCSMAGGACCNGNGLTVFEGNCKGPPPVPWVGEASS